MRYLFACGALFLATGAMAQEQYTTSQLVEFYINSVDMGASRGICIRTASECEPPAAPAALDMRVRFELESVTLTPDAQASLGVFAQTMLDERLEVAHFVVEGHTDARGTDLYNLDLSDEHAASVKAFLIGLGVAQDRLTAPGLEKSRARVADDTDPEFRRMELRVDLRGASATSQTGPPLDGAGVTNVRPDQKEPDPRSDLRMSFFTLAGAFCTRPVLELIRRLVGASSDTFVGATLIRCSTRAARTAQITLLSSRRPESRAAWAPATPGRRVWRDSSW